MDRISDDTHIDDNGDDEAQRAYARDSLLLLALFRYDGKPETIQARVRNLSSGGLMVEVPTHVDIGVAVEVEVRGVGWVPGRVAWVAKGRVGVAFDYPVDPVAARKPVINTIVPTKSKPIKPLF